ncbi:MAG TPA: hypothetical protein VGB18_09805 [Candidatus Thermoplasmatota archaeon]
MHTTVLLLDEGTALAFVGIVAIVAVCLLSVGLVVLAIVALRRRDPSYPVAPSIATAAPLPIPSPQLRAGGSRKKPPASRIKNVEIDVPTRHADAIIHALQASGWFVRDTGEVVATDEDEEGLTTISVDVPGGNVFRPSSGEEVQ